MFFDIHRTPSDSFFRAILAVSLAVFMICCKDDDPVVGPVITDFSPAKGSVGTVVIITGSNFSGLTKVEFNGIPAVVSEATDVSIKTVVPEAAETGRITVTVMEKTGTGDRDFVVEKLNVDPDDPEEPETPRDVYVAGFARNESGASTATYWKNGVPVYLSPVGSEVLAMDISGDDIYMCGRHGYNDEGYIGGYWKNDVMVSLPDCSVATDIKVSGTDVYVIGLDQTQTVTKFWKNGVATNLAGENSYVWGLAILGNDVYVVGREFIVDKGSVARLWKNGVAETLKDIGSPWQGTYAYDIAISGDDVYVVGGEGDNAVIWTNGVPRALDPKTIGTYAYAITVSGKDIHVAGKSSNGDPQTTHWKNNDKRRIMELGRSGSSISVLGDDVYIAGPHLWEKNAVYWKNGEMTTLPNNGRAAQSNVIGVKSK